MIVFAVAENQAQLGTRLAEAGAAIYAGHLSDITPLRLSSLITDLAIDRDRRVAMSQAARDLVDGHGAFRVVTAMRALDVALRPAERGDAHMLYSLAMNSDVRQWSFNPEPFSFSDHLRWLAARLEDTACRMYIISDEAGRPVGHVRFEDRPNLDAAEIAVALSPAARGLGLAGPAIAASVGRYVADGGRSTVLAQIKPGNSRSIRAFLNADFDNATSAHGPLHEGALQLKWPAM